MTLLLCLCTSSMLATDYHYVNTSTWELTSNFRSALTQDGTSRTIDGNTYSKTRKFGSTKTSLGNPNDIGTNYIVYEAKTSTVNFDIYVYNKNSSDKTLYISVIEEGASSATTTTKTATKSTGTKITFSATTNTKNKTIYFYVNSTDILVGDIVAKETGDALPSGGEVNFSMSFNKGRSAIKSGTVTTIEGMDFCLNSNYSALSSTEAVIKTKGTHYVKFTTTETARTKITVSGSNTYYIASEQNPADVSGLTAYTSSADVNLAAGEWYLVPNGSNVSITNIAFETPDITAPVLDAENSVPADGATNVAVSGTIVLKFNEEIKTVDASKYSINNGGSITSVAIDGTDKTKVKVVYTGLGYFTNTTLTIAAEGFADAFGNSNASEVTLSFKTMKETVANPAISPADGKTFSGATQSVTITCDTDAATIYYTTDGTTPTALSAEYTDAFTISSTTTIKAIALKDGLEDSEVVTATITKVISTPWNSWDFTNWSSATQTGVRADGTNWRDYEDSSTDKPLNDKVYSNKVGNGTFVYGSTTIPETEGLSFKTTAYTFGLAFNQGSTTLGTYNGSQYLWLYGTNSTITIPSVPAGATIEMGVESHKTSEERTLTLTNASVANVKATTYATKSFTASSTGDLTITPNKGMHIYYITVTANVETVPVTIASGKEYTTLTSASNLNFTDVDGLKPYVVTADISDNKVTLSQRNKMAAGNGMVLKAETPGKTYNVPVFVGAGDDVTGNKMVGSATAATPIDADGGYILKDGVFQPALAGSLPAGKAYLNIAVTSAHPLTITFDDENGETTAIKGVEAQKFMENNKFYNLNGQEVQNPTKGLYIVNGKKVIIK